MIATAESEELPFFAIGAGIRNSLIAACSHAVGEVAVAYEDAKLERSGYAATVAARSNILSLRDREQFHERKRYFLSLSSHPASAHTIPLVPSVYSFSVLGEFHAARASTKDLLTPRQFHNHNTDVPVLPIF
ncbi:hypothetical protein Busp01_40570 [Trinickia caryophylli]|nr:hypothetical protein Busp01_40570 [Trinickia caryophylli]